MIIAVFTGGDSSEKVISVKSGKQVKKWLEESGHICYMVDVSGNAWTVDTGNGSVEFDRSLPGFILDGKKQHVDFVWNIIHGTPGEDGRLQGCLDIMKMPYSSCGQLASALTFNKYTCKVFLEKHGILTPASALIRKGEQAKLAQLEAHTGLPCFVKPNNGGSSFGISKVNLVDELPAAIKAALEEDDEVIVEQFVKGREISCGLMRCGEEFTVFPLTEVTTENEFFDYEAKYTPGKSREITPAPVDEDIAAKCREEAIKIYKLLDCSGIVRIDFIISDGKAWFLELNSIPGMSEESIVPQQIESMGEKISHVLQKVIDHVI